MTYHREHREWMSEDDTLVPANPIVIASDQITDALLALDRHPSTFVRWPFADLDALTGPMAPGNVWFVCASSGGGKTTFISSVVDLWRLGGKKVYVMPLETRAHEFRTYLACMATGIHPGDALSGQLQSLPNYRALRETLRSEITSQINKPYVDLVMVSGTRAINLDGLANGLKEAKGFGADVVIVDHIDHIEGGNGSNMYAEAKRVNDGAMRMAQDNGLLLVFTSQLNQSAAKGDYLSKYLPPRRDHVAFGTLKERNATGMIGLFRPMRKQQPGESEDDYLKAVRSARAGTSEITTILEPNTMGVVAMKLRNYGAREGQKTYLRVEHGRALPMDEKDRYTTAGGVPRQML